jgi:hypothetical protein
VTYSRPAGRAKAPPKELQKDGPRGVKPLRFLKVAQKGVYEDPFFVLPFETKLDEIPKAIERTKIETTRGYMYT